MTGDVGGVEEVDGEREEEAEAADDTAEVAGETEPMVYTDPGSGPSVS